MDSDLNGIPDIIEDIVLTNSQPFVGIPFVITGCIEAEQFDKGGKGVAYTNASMNTWTNDYRASGMEITNCNDRGGGYCVNNLRSNEWLNYTIDVRVSQTYAIEPRIAGIGTGGVFRSNSGRTTSNTPIRPDLTVVTTNWTNITSPMIRLQAGTNIMKVVMITNSSDNIVGKLNYISVYPAWNVGFTNYADTRQLTTNDLYTGSDWTSASNNAVKIQDKLNELTAGGLLTLPAGRFYVAQKHVDESSTCQFNTAVFIHTNNVEIRGAGKTNTILVAHNRATTIFLIGEDPLQFLKQRTNVVFRDLSLEGQPHIVVTDSTTGQSTWEQGSLWNHPNDANLGHLIFCIGESTNLYSHNIIFTNCLFRNPSLYALFIPGRCSNIAVRACEFLYRDGMSGSFPFPRYITNTSISTTITNPYPFGNVGVMIQGLAGRNVIVTDCVFNGNPSLASSPTNHNENDVGDGIVWFQAGGNWFILEGVRIGFIGMTLRGTPGIVTQAGMRGLSFLDEVETAQQVRRAAARAGRRDDRRAAARGRRPVRWRPVDGCTGLTGPIVGIAGGLDDAVDVVVSGHTHQAYNCVLDGKIVTSASSFGRVVTDIDLMIDPGTGDVTGKSARNVVVGRDLPADPQQTALLEQYRSLLGPIAGREVGETPVALTREQEACCPSRNRGASRCWAT